MSVTKSKGALNGKVVQTVILDPEETKATIRTAQRLGIPPLCEEFNLEELGEGKKKKKKK